MNLVSGMIGKAGIIDPVDFRAPRKEFGDFKRRFVLALDAQGEWLHYAQQQPGVERAQAGAFSVLIKSYTAMEIIIVRDQRARGHVAMTAEEFRGRMNDHVRAEFERFLKAWREHRVVNGQQRPGLAR